VILNGVWIGFIDHFNTQLVITLDYSAIADLHTLQINRAHTKSFLARNVSTSNCLATASNSGCFQAQVLSEW
jgi:hypothetical protein